MIDILSMTIPNYIITFILNFFYSVLIYGYYVYANDIYLHQQQNAILIRIIIYSYCVIKFNYICRPYVLYLFNYIILIATTILMRITKGAFN